MKKLDRLQKLILYPKQEGRQHLYSSVKDRETMIKIKIHGRVHCHRNFITRLLTNNQKNCKRNIKGNHIQR